MNEISIRPVHYASVSGGKDSLYMMKVILENPQKYPLDMVVHFELEIDHDFVADAVDAIGRMCSTLNIPFKRIRPRKSYQELYEKYGLPGRMSRWCNNMYKLDAKRQLNDWIRSQRCRPVCYIGFCADEVKRFKYNVGTWNPEKEQDVCYPLAEEGISEERILQWARTQSIWGGWYDVFRRQGCWLCPNATRLELAHLYLHHRDKYDMFVRLASEYEQSYGKPYFSGGWIDSITRGIEEKWAPKLSALEKRKRLF